MRWIDWFGDDWQRPRPALGRTDLQVALVATAVLLGCQALVRSFASLEWARPSWVEYGLLGLLFPLLLLRRRWPLTVACLAFCHFFVALSLVPHVNQLSYQLVIFTCLYSGVAWGRDRRATALVMAALNLGMVLWLAWGFAVGKGIEQYREGIGEGAQGGIVSPVVAWVLFSLVINLAFMGGSVAMGQAAWNQARDRDTLARQAETIRAQADELRDQAVVDERLRIARELHDVVAHHVSVMGIQAAGARRLLAKDPETAATALENVEQSSRQAVTQMRSLLGALRGSGDPDPTREPQPSLAELPALLDEVRDAGLSVEMTTVENRPGAAVALPLPVQLSLYRTVQEALANVRRHSTARHATVALRVETTGHGRGWAEVECIDDGHPLGGTSGSGLGLLGMRERVTSHGGTSEIGPRITGGYRVRVRLPVGDSGTTMEG